MRNWFAISLFMLAVLCVPLTYYLMGKVPSNLSVVTGFGGFILAVALGAIGLVVGSPKLEDDDAG